ncbi:glycosyltransferase [Pseudacidobacterium ailaaui]|uniref:glycosyltransferase n=1 Tax=Pseudacidobacterium ailaaui TaxID=1382359 RepID=UPI00047A7054|nr:glycosyltransferase [Pseudacidobacterium ailaaui]
MRFVWIMKEVPFNPESGLLIYSNGLLRGVLENGAQGVLVAFERASARGVTLPGLEVSSVRLKKKVRALSLLTKYHSDSYRHKSAEFIQAVMKAMQTGPDFVIIDYFAMGWVLPFIKKCIAVNGNRPLIIYISHNYESNLRFDVARSMRDPIMRAVLMMDARKALRLEKDLVAACDLIVVNTDEDKQLYENDSPGKATITLTPAYDGEITPVAPLTQQRPKRVIIVGAFDWIAKQANLRRFLQLAEDPFRKAGIDILIVGRAPETFINEMSARFSFCKFTGRVDDVRAYLTEGRIGLMPDDVGGGFKHKYLYYIFAGLPVATVRSQVAGLPIDPDHDFIARETMEELVDAIVKSIDDIPYLNALQKRCWESCAHSFNWQDRGTRLAKKIKQLRAVN